MSERDHRAHRRRALGRDARKSGSSARARRLLARAGEAIVARPRATTRSRSRYARSAACGLASRASPPRRARAARFDSVVVLRAPSAQSGSPHLWGRAHSWRHGCRRGPWGRAHGPVGSCPRACGVGHTKSVGSDTRAVELDPRPRDIRPGNRALLAPAKALQALRLFRFLAVSWHEPVTPACRAGAWDLAAALPEGHHIMPWRVEDELRKPSEPTTCRRERSARSRSGTATSSSPASRTSPAPRSPRRSSRRSADEGRGRRRRPHRRKHRSPARRCRSPPSASPATTLATPSRLSRSQRSLDAASPADAVAGAEIVVISVPWDAIPTALEQAGPLEGKVVIDTTNQSGCHTQAPGPRADRRRLQRGAHARRALQRKPSTR